MGGERERLRLRSRGAHPQTHPLPSPGTGAPRPVQINARTMAGFDHQKLDAYTCAIEFVGCARAIAGALPKGESHLADQLHRASTSIALNLAEGAGEFSAPEKLRFYRIARRSATECAAIVDILHAQGLVATEAAQAATTLLDRIVAMLTRMVTRTGRER